MKYTNTHAYTHIRALAALLAFASVILAPATASAQNATSQQPAATAAGSSENSDTTNQATEQTSAQPPLSLQQRLVRRKAWINYYVNPQDKKLEAYINFCADWRDMYETVAAPAIKKYGSKQEQEMAGIISKSMKDFIKANVASWDRTRKPFNILDQTADRLIAKPSEKNFEQYILKSEDTADVFNTESENIFKIGQTIAGYHQQITTVLDGIIARLRENPKTQADADKIDRRWQREPDFLKVKAPIKLMPFDPTKPIASTPAGKAGKGQRKQ